MGLKISPVFHHMVCAYVGPEYDFDITADGPCCPKCRRVLRDEADDWEVTASSTRCPACEAEFVVSDQPSRCALSETVTS